MIRKHTTNILSRLINGTRHFWFLNTSKVKIHFFLLFRCLKYNLEMKDVQKYRIQTQRLLYFILAFSEFFNLMLISQILSTYSKQQTKMNPKIAPDLSCWKCKRCICIKFKICSMRFSSSFFRFWFFHFLFLFNFTCDCVLRLTTLHKYKTWITCFAHFTRTRSIAKR